jgi:hypothetical protein
VAQQGLDALRARVHADAELARRLRRIDPARFADEVVAVAASVGIGVTRRELEAAVERGRGAWMLRWIQ